MKPLGNGEFKVTCLRFAMPCGRSGRLRLDLVPGDFAAGTLSAKQITTLRDDSSWHGDAGHLSNSPDWSGT